MYKRHENELLVVLIHAHTLQEQNTDFWTAGHWHQSPLRSRLHTTWSTTHTLIQFSSPPCAAHPHNRLSPTLRFNSLIFLCMTYLIALLCNILNRPFYYGHSNFIYDVLYSHFRLLLWIGPLITAGMLPWHWPRHERRGYRIITVVLAEHKNGSMMMFPTWTETCGSDRRNF
jgi:hypothetical protein